MAEEKATNTGKKTNEKPVSLYPLDFKEALAALLGVKPKPKEDDKQEQDELLEAVEPSEE